MLGFTLSKINLLILAVAIFAIVSYFVLSFSDIGKIREAQLLLDKMSRKAATMIASPSYCDSAQFEMPPSLNVAGEPFYYVVKVTKQKAENEENVNYVVFSLFPRKQQQNSLAANSFKTVADVHIYNSSELELEEATGTEGMLLDPQARFPTNAMVMVKEIIGGKSFLFLVPCSYDKPGDCSVKKGQAAKLFGKGEEGFSC